MLLPLTFPNFVDLNNPSILQSLRLLLPKASASTFCSFEICEKIAWQLKVLAIFYLYRSTITFNVKLQQVLLVTELNKVRNFCQHTPGFSIPFAFVNISQKFFT